MILRGGNNLLNSRYNDEQRRIVWCQKYLNLPLESMNFNDRLLIEGYKEEGRIKPTIHTEKIQIKDDDDEEENNDKVVMNPFLRY